MPVDASRRPGGNIEIHDGIAVVVKPEPHVVRHFAHFATCVVVKERRRIEAAARQKDRDQAAARQLGLFGAQK